MRVRIRISKLMGERKMNMRELSQLTGIRPNTISNLYYEEAKRIEINHIAALCNALKCSVGDLFEIEE